MEKEKLVVASVGMAMMTGRVELLRVAIRGLREEAEAGELVGEKLEQLINTVEAACEHLLDARHPPRSEFEEEEDDDLDYAGL